MWSQKTSQCHHRWNRKFDRHNSVVGHCVSLYGYPKVLRAQPIAWGALMVLFVLLVLVLVLMVTRFAVARHIYSRP